MFDSVILKSVYLIYSFISKKSFQEGTVRRNSLQNTLLRWKYGNQWFKQVSSKYIITFGNLEFGIS